MFRTSGGSDSTERPTTAWLGTFSTFSSRLVSISASPFRPEGITCPSVSSRIFASKNLVLVVRSSVFASATFSTAPSNTSSSNACIRTLAFWPTFTLAMDDSSTRATSHIFDKSATSSSMVPGLFMVPMRAISPTSASRLVTTPSIGLVRVA